MPITVEVPGVGLIDFDDDFTEDQISQALATEPWKALGGTEAEAVATPSAPVSRTLAVPPINEVNPVGEMSMRGYDSRETERTANIAQAGAEAIGDTLSTPLYKPFGIESLPTVTGQEVERSLGAPAITAAIAPGLTGLAVQTPRTTAQVIAGLQQAVIGATEFFTTPAGALTLGASELPQLAQKGVAAYFVYQMAKQQPEMVKELAEAWYADDPERLTRAAGSLGLNTAFIAGGTKAVLAKARPERPPVIEQPQQPTTEVPGASQIKTSEAVYEPVPEIAKESAKEVPVAPSGERVQPVTPAIPTTEPTVAKPATVEPAAEATVKPGPGAMTAGELSPEAAFITSIKNTWTDADAARFGLEPVERGERRHWRDTVIPEAEAEIRNNPQAAERIMEKVKADPNYRMQDVETAILLQRKADIINEMNRAAKRLAEAREIKHVENEIMEMVRINDLSDMLQEIREVSKESGTPLGQALAARKMLMREDYSLATLTARKASALGRPLEPAEFAKIEALEAKIKDLESKLKQAEEARAQEGKKAQEEQAHDETVKAARREKAKKESVDSVTEGQNIIERMRKRLEEGDTAEDLYAFVQKLHENLQRQALDISGTPMSRVEVVDAIHTILTKDLGLDLPKEFRGTQGEVNTSDLISGIGRATPLTTDTAKLAKMDVREQEQKIGKINRYLNKLAAPKTGPERKKSSAEARQLEKEGRKLAREMGIRITDPATQLANSLSAIKTRLRNEIEEIDLAIAGKKPMVKKDGGVAYDAEATALRAQRDAKKADYDALFPKEPLTDEVLLQRAIKIAERNEATANATLERARRGDFEPKPIGRQLPPSAQLDAIKARTEAIRQEVQSLRDLDENFQKQKRFKEQTRQIGEVDKRIEEVTRQINEGDIAAKKPSGKPVLPELAQKRAELAELNKIKAKLRAAEKAPTAAEREAKSNAALQERIDELVRQINEGDIAVKPKTPQQVSAEKAALRAELAELNKIKQQLRNAAKPKKTPEELALQSWRTRLTNRIADLKEKVAKGEFTTQKRTPFQPTTTADLALKAELKKIKDEFDIGVAKDRLANRTKMEKIRDGIKLTEGALVNVVSSFDFSAPRQALGFLLTIPTRLVTNPIRGSRMLVTPFYRMFSAAFSEQRARIIEQRIKHRPNAISGADQLAKIEFSELQASKFTKAEENARSILDEWAALPLRTGNLAKTVATAAPKLPIRIVRGSNRAFTTFLNSARASLFDELLRVNYGDRTPSAIQLRVVGNLVNVATGRGKLHPTTARVTAKFIWSPKLLAARLQALTGQPFWTEGHFAETAKARKIVAKEYARAIIGGYLLWKVSQFFSDRPTDDSTSSDFGKAVVGDVRIDLWGGMQQPVVLGSRIATATSTSLKGNTQDVGAAREFGTKGLWHFIADFGRSKLRPTVGAGIDIATRSNYIGEPTTPATVAESLLVPLPMRDIVSIMEAQGFTRGMIMEALGIFGAGVSNYEQREGQK